MSSRQANSLEVEFVNGTSSSTLRFFHRTGLCSSHRKKLKTLPPLRGENMTVSSFVFRFEKGTNEFIELEYKVEVENEDGSPREKYKRVDVQIDTTKLHDHSKITVLDSEAAQNGAAASSSKKFKLQAVPRAVTYEAGWLGTLVVKLGLMINYVRSLFATQPPAPASEPPAAAPGPPV